MVPAKVGNLLPTYYDARQWQGLVYDAAHVLNPRVELMNAEQLRLDIVRQHATLENFQQVTVAMGNFAKNITDVTQPPTSEMWYGLNVVG